MHMALSAAPGDDEDDEESVEDAVNRLIESRKMLSNASYFGLLREHDRALSELQSLADVPDLPETAREDRLAAEQVLRRAEQDLEGARLELARCTDALAALAIEKPLLEHADAIERLVANLETAARSRIETRQQQALVEQIGTDLAASTVRIAPDLGLDTVVGAVPSAADRVALDAHLDALSVLGERLQGHRSRVEELNEAMAFDPEDIPPLPDPAARERLGVALRNAQRRELRRKSPCTLRSIASLIISRHTSMRAGWFLKCPWIHPFCAQSRCIVAKSIQYSSISSPMH